MSPTKTTNDGHDIVVHLHELLTGRDMTLTELAERVGVTLANLSILKNGHAKAMRFTTLTAICRELHCQPGDLLTYQPQLEAPLPPNAHAPPPSGRQQAR